MLRSIFATLAAAWFGLQALTFGGDLGADPSGIAGATRAICIGLAILSLAAIEWDWRSAPAA